MNFERELLKGVLPTVVLEVLSKKTMYGYELSEELSRKSQDIFKLGKGTLYPLLYNLEAKALIKGQWSDGDTGRKRKYYAITAKGQTHLTKSREQLEALQKGLNLVLTPTASFA